jgi:hypothetical protein
MSPMSGQAAIPLPSYRAVKRSSTTDTFFSGSYMWLTSVVEAFGVLLLTLVATTFRVILLTFVADVLGVRNGLAG